MDDTNKTQNDNQNLDATNSEAETQLEQESTQRQVEENPVDEETSKLAAELEMEKTKRLELFADFQNYQRRIESEKATWAALSNMGIINEILEIYDDLQLALNDADLNLDTSKDAIKSAQSKMNTVLESAGVEKIEVKVGDEFDKESMEAVSTLAAGEEQKNKVIAVITSAIKLKSKEGIFKPAKVVVGK